MEALAPSSGVITKNIDVGGGSVYAAGDGGPGASSEARSHIDICRKSLGRTRTVGFGGWPGHASLSATVGGGVMDASSEARLRVDICWNKSLVRARTVGMTAVGTAGDNMCLLELQSALVLMLATASASATV